MIDPTTTTRFEAALSSGHLRELADQYYREGLSQVAIFLLFESFWYYVTDEKRNVTQQKRRADEEVLMTSMDCIVGYISRHSWWFDRRLSNEEINEYRKTIVQHNAPPNGGPATRLGDSSAKEGPPSVS